MGSLLMAEWKNWLASEKQCRQLWVAMVLMGGRRWRANLN
jgi:hypothetical protein